MFSALGRLCESFSSTISCQDCCKKQTVYNIGRGVVDILRERGDNIVELAGNSLDHALNQVGELLGEAGFEGVQRQYQRLICRSDEELVEQKERLRSGFLEFMQDQIEELGRQGDGTIKLLEGRVRLNLAAELANIDLKKTYNTKGALNIIETEQLEAQIGKVKRLSSTAADLWHLLKEEYFVDSLKRLRRVHQSGVISSSQYETLQTAYRSNPSDFFEIFNGADTFNDLPTKYKRLLLDVADKEGKSYLRGHSFRDWTTKREDRPSQGRELVESLYEGYEKAFDEDGGAFADPDEEQKLSPTFSADRLTKSTDIGTLRFRQDHQRHISFTASLKQYIELITKPTSGDRKGEKIALGIFILHAICEILRICGEKRVTIGLLQQAKPTPRIDRMIKERIRKVNERQGAILKLYLIIKETTVPSELEEYGLGPFTRSEIKTQAIKNRRFVANIRKSVSLSQVHVDTLVILYKISSHINSYRELNLRYTLDKWLPDETSISRRSTPRSSRGDSPVNFEEAKNVEIGDLETELKSGNVIRKEAVEAIVNTSLQELEIRLKANHTEALRLQKEEFETDLREQLERNQREYDQRLNSEIARIKTVYAENLRTAKEEFEASLIAKGLREESRARSRESFRQPPRI